MDLPKLTADEQQALIGALMHNFGPCTCANVGGMLARCEGHRFLAETQAFGRDRDEISRVQRLVITRRAAHIYTQAEFGRPMTLEPEPLPERDVLPPDLFGSPPTRESPVPGDDTETLPW